MQVIDLAQDLKVPADGLVLLLRELGIHVAGAGSDVSEADISRVLARIERERRAGHKGIPEALEAAIEDAQSAHRPTRRRRRPAKRKVEEVPVDGADSVEADSPEATAAEKDEPEVEAEASTDSAETPEVEVEVEVEAEAPEVEEADPLAEALEGVVEEADVAAAENDEVEEDPGLEMAEDEEWEGEESPVLELEEGSIEGLEVSDLAPKPEPVRRSGPEGPARVIRKPVSSPAASAAPGGQVRIQAEGYTADGHRKSKKDKKGKKRRARSRSGSGLPFG